MAAGTSQLIAGFIAAFLAGAGGAIFWDGQALEIDAAPQAEPSASHETHASQPAPVHAHEPAALDPDAAPAIEHEPPFDLEDGTRPTMDQAKQFTKKYSRFI